MLLYRSTPQAIVGHVLASTLIAYAMWPAVPSAMLLGWLGSVYVISAVRTGTCIIFLRNLPIPDNDMNWWTRSLTALAFLQALAWGLSVFVIWPEQTEYRALLITTLAGVIAAGGVMLAVHRRSFLIYCLPISIPAVAQLVASGGRIELTIGLLIVLYSLMLIVAVNRLGESFFEGMLVRLQMESLSRMDPLTHIANRRGFTEFIDGAWQNAIRSRQAIGLILADIDHFKSYNDQYGHPQGDVALSRVASVLNDVVGRSTDLCARVGGEEFAIMLPSTDTAGTRMVAEHIQEELARAAIKHEGAPQGVLTISMGFGAFVPDRSNTIDSFYSIVDEALYEAKRNGRNRIEMADMPVLETDSASADENSIDPPEPNP